MKRIMIAFIALASLSFQANAQVKREQKANKGEMRSNNGKQMGKDAFKDLNLTADQQAKLKASRESAKLKLDAIKNDNSLTDQQRKDKMTELRKEQKTSMESILTTEQKNKLKETQAARKQKMDDRKNDKKNDRVDEVKNKQGLSNEQAAKIKEYNKASQLRMKAIKDNSSLTQEQKKEKIMAEQKAKKDFLNTLLTPEQKEKMKEGMKKGKNKRGNSGINTNMNTR